MKIELKDYSDLKFKDLEYGTVFEYEDKDASKSRGYGIKIEVLDEDDRFLDLDLNVAFEFNESYYKIIRIINAKLVEV